MTARQRGEWQGSNWIRKEKRLAIYMRDGLACAWCGAGVEDGAQLTLDHLRPSSKDGTNEATNLVTACERCNKARGNRGVREFSRVVAEYLNNGITVESVENHVRNTARRKVDLEAAKEMLSRRGSVAKVLADLPKEE
jgi:hypothetical protein